MMRSSNNGSPREYEVAPLRRMNSGPFVRKPIPHPVKDDDYGRGDSSSGYEKHTKPSGNLLSTTPNTSYSSIVEQNDVVQEEKPSNFDQSSSSLERHLSLFDATAIGVGGTIGSGLFVLSGMVAHDFAGPATAVSWAVSGIAALMSGCCYAELAARIPLSGSAYAYTYVAMGELPAVLAAGCLSVEFMTAAAAVSRSWGDKIVTWLSEELSADHWLQPHLTVNGKWSPLALLISSTTVILLLNGVKESKMVTNIVTTIKLLVVAFMIIVGFVYVRPSNWTPFIPSSMGVSGVLRGAMGTFFGYMGYDQICGLGGEVQNPQKNLPRAILLTLAIVSALYILSSLALTGMQRYTEISSVSGFPVAFRANNAHFAAEVTAIGEIITLPIVILICTMAQPRLQYAMAKDGLLPNFFLEMDSHGNLFNGTASAGALMVLIATFVPFTHLNDMISCAVLCGLSMTNTSLVILWHESPESSPGLAERLLLIIHMSSLVGGIALAHFWDSYTGKTLFVLALCPLIMSTFGIHLWCPRNPVFGGCQRWPKSVCFSYDKVYFRTPFLPFLPCAAIFLNWYLISQLELFGICSLVAFLLLATAYYFSYAAKHSVTNNSIESTVEETADLVAMPLSIHP